MIVRVVAGVLAVFFALSAIGIAIQVDWAALISGDSERVRDEVQGGTGFSWILVPVFALLAFFAVGFAMGDPDDSNDDAETGL